MSYHKSGTINKKTQTISSVPNAVISRYDHRYFYQNNAHQVTTVGPNFAGGSGGLNDKIEYNSEGSVKKMYEEITTPGDTNKLRKFVWNENQQLMGVRNPNGIHHYLYDANHATGVTGAQRIMKGSLRRNGAVLNGAGGENSYIADPYLRRDCEAKGEARRAKLARPSPPLWRDTIYVNPYYIITHYANWTEATKHYYKGSQRVAAALEADNDLSDIETSPTSIGVKTNLLNLLNMVGAQEGVDYQQQSLYGKEPQTYAQAVMSLEDYTTLINDNLEEDPGTPPEGQDRCTFSRYWPHQNHNLDCDPVIYFYHPDYLGHTEYITDRNGDAYQYFHYSAFGETLIEEHSGQGTHTDYFRFNGKELDPETGNYYYGARYYDPKVSVWLSVDRLAEKYPGLSPYNFTANNPINLIDPNGDSVNVAAFIHRHADQWEETKSDLEELGGLKLGTSKSGNITYEIDENAEGFSKTAREKMIAAFSDKETVKVAALEGSRSNADGNNIILSMSQISGFIDNTSEGLSDKTLGFGMTFLHELGHTKLGGSMEDFTAFGTNGSNVNFMNKIRAEMSRATSTNWGERFYGAKRTWNTSMYVLPFSKNTKTMLDETETIMGPHILTPKPKF